MPKTILKRVLPARKRNAHKGDFGHVFILAGSPGLTGAAYLTSQAALLSGSGLVTLGIPESLNPIMERKLTEVMTRPLAQTKEKTLSLKALSQIKKILPKIDALAVGPGLSRNPETQKLVLKLLSSVRRPLVLDADGINALIKRLTILKKAKAEVVITPHPGEMARVLNLKTRAIQKNRIKAAKDFAKKYNVVIVLKGHRTVIAERSGRSYINKTGNPGMASGGSGDVLTGMIASFLGQGMSPFQAARTAVYVHGLAGDLAAEEKGETSLIATDILNKLPQALKAVA
jgi:NAD(P)H-hydrate epimerase